MPNLRRNILYLNPQEKINYLNALWKLKNTIKPGSTLSIYDEYALMHRCATKLQWNKQNQDVGHNASDSLPWHRALLAQFEGELQKVDPTVSLVYWDFTDVKSVKAAFSNDFMGEWVQGTGLQLKGPLTGWTRVPTAEYVGAPLTVREYNIATPEGYVDLMKNRFNINNIIEAHPNYKEFGEALNQIHGVTHFVIGGPNGDQRDLLTAVNDPAFWMIHTFMDYYWTVWQDRHDKYASSNHQFYIEAASERPSQLGLRENEVMWPWDNDKYKFEVEIPAESAMVQKFLGEIRKTPTITVASTWNFRASRTGYEVDGGELIIGYETKFDLAIRQSIIFTLRVPEELHNSPFDIKTTGDPKLVLRLYGPANCDDCYGPLALTDTGSGPEGPQVTQVLAKGKYHIVVHPIVSTDDVDVFGLKVDVLYSPEDPPYVPPTHPVYPGPPGPYPGPFPGPFPGGRGMPMPGPGMPMPGPGMPFGRGMPPPGGRGMPFGRGMPPPGGYPMPPGAMMRPPAFGPIGGFVPTPQPTPPPTRYIPLTLGSQRQVSLPLHGGYVAFFFAIEKNSRVAIDFRGIPVSNVSLKKDGSGIDAIATSGSQVNAVLHKQLTAGNYNVIVHSNASTPGRFTIVVQASAV